MEYIRILKYIIYLSQVSKTDYIRTHYILKKSLLAVGALGRLVGTGRLLKIKLAMVFHLHNMKVFLTTKPLAANWPE